MRKKVPRPADGARLLPGASRAAGDLWDAGFRAGWDAAVEFFSRPPRVDLDRETDQVLKELEGHAKSWGTGDGKTRVRKLARGADGTPGILERLGGRTAPDLRPSLAAALIALVARSRAESPGRKRADDEALLPKVVELVKRGIPNKALGAELNGTAEVVAKRVRAVAVKRGFLRRYQRK